MSDATQALGAAPVVSRRDGPVAWIVLNRPERMNALAGTMRDDLYDAIRTAAEDASVRVVVITGAGPAFCAGADLDTFAEMVRDDDSERLEALMRAGARTLPTRVHGLAGRRARYGLATMCTGVGQGIAMIVERVEAA